MKGGTWKHEIRRANAVLRLFLVEMDRTGKSEQSRSLERCWLKNQNRRHFHSCNRHDVGSLTLCHHYSVFPVAGELFRQ